MSADPQKHRLTLTEQVRLLEERLARANEENARLRMRLEDMTHEDTAPLDPTPAMDIDADLRAQQRMESLGTMARGMGHEINNPLNVIINCAELVGDGLPAGAPERVDLQEIKEAAERIRKVVKVMLRFSEPEAVQMTPTEPEGPVGQVADLLRTDLELQGIRLEVALPEGLPMIRIRRRQFEQILINLVQNAAEALEHADDRRITISGQHIENGGLHWVRLSVIDSGEGISADEQERVFDPFFTTRSRHQHAGLGLTVAHGYVRAHGGEITIDSSEGAGTTVHVDLPSWSKKERP